LKKYKDIALAGLFIILAFCIRIADLERQSLWNDEMFSMDVAGHSIGSIQETLVTYYHHPPLFFYLAHWSTSVLGMTAWALRFPSAIFGALTVGLVYLFGQRLFNRYSGIIAAIFCMVAPFHLAYSQEGRPYTLAGFLCLASFYLFYRYIFDRHRVFAFLYLLTTIALLYTHHWGMFVLAVQIVGIFIIDSGISRRRYSLYILWLIIVILYLPEYFALRNQFLRVAMTDWFWAQAPNWLEIYHLITAFSGTYFNMASSIFSVSLAIQIAGAIFLAGLLIASIIIAIRSDEARALRFSLVSFGGIIVVPFVISFIKPEIFLWYRYTVIAFPLLCIITGGVLYVLSQSRISRILGWSAAIGLIVIGMYGSMRYMTWQKSNVKDASEYTQELVIRNAVRIIIRPKTFAPLLNYYYHGSAVQYDEAYLNQPLGGIIDTAASFVYVSLDIPNEIRDYLDGHFDKHAERHFPGEAHMGMVVGFYKQKEDIDTDEE
jgi:mannosyltransferase